MFQGKKKQKSSLVTPKDLKVLQNQAQTEAEGQKKEQQWAGYRQRAEPIQEDVKHSPQIFVCDQCQIQTQKPGLCDKCMGVQRVTCLTCKTQYPANQGYCRKCEIACPQCRAPKLRTLPRCLNCTPACPQCRTAFDPQFGICRRCEVICKGCGKVASSTQSYCVHCNTVLKEKLGKQCGQQQAPSVSSLCKDCASRPAVSQFMKKGKAMPKHLLMRR